MVNAQKWLDKNYPKNSRSKIKELNIKYKNLEGQLSLEDFDNLKELYCSSNFLTSISLSNINIEKLTVLDIRNNNFPQADLSFFVRFVNLKILQIGNDKEEKIDQSIHNRWFGSLEFLQNLQKLKVLDIDNTDVDEGLEYLPDSVEKIYCDNNHRSLAACCFIVIQLRKHKVNVINNDVNSRWVSKLENSCYYDVKTWKKSNYFYQQKLELEEEIKNLKLNSQSQELKLVNKVKSLENQLLLRDVKITNLEKKLEQGKNSNLSIYIQNKKNELDQLVTTTKNKLDEDLQEWLEMLLEMQLDLNDNLYLQKQCDRVKKNLSKQLSEQELKIILDKKVELTKLENLQIQKQEEECKTQIEIPGKSENCQ